MCCAADIHNLYLSHMCKIIFRYDLIKQKKSVKFSRNCRKFHIFMKIAISKYNWNFVDQLLLHFKFYGRDM